MKRHAGLFVTFEGPEGAGKSTQIDLLRQHLARLGLPCLVTREPGGTPLAEELRAIVKHRNDAETLHDTTELLLIAAARSQHVREKIAPALQRGEVVLCDRFADSTEAYQGAGRGLDRQLIATLRAAACGDCEPDLTIILDLPVESGFARTRSRSATQGNFDRFEAQEYAFHQRVREAFLAIAEREPRRVKVVDADRDPEIVRQAVREAFDAAL